MSEVAHLAEAYPGFCSMKRLGVFLLPPGWDASPSQGYPQHLICLYPFIHLGGERLCESKVSYPRIQHYVASQDSNPDRSIQRQSVLTMRPTHLTHSIIMFMNFLFSCFSNCRKNKPLFQAGPFDQAFNITDRLNIEKVSPSGILSDALNFCLSVCY